MLLLARRLVLTPPTIELVDVLMMVWGAGCGRIVEGASWGFSEVTQVFCILTTAAWEAGERELFVLLVFP